MLNASTIYPVHVYMQIEEPTARLILGETSLPHSLPGRWSWVCWMDVSCGHLESLFLLREDRRTSQHPPRRQQNEGTRMCINLVAMAWMIRLLIQSLFAKNLDHYQQLHLYIHGKCHHSHGVAFIWTMQTHSSGRCSLWLSMLTPSGLTCISCHRSLLHKPWHWETEDRVGLPVTDYGTSFTVRNFVLLCRTTGTHNTPSLADL